MEKKGIMLDFLLTVILTIIIFVPAILMVSKFFNQSDQAKDSFNAFAEQIKSVQQSHNSQSHILILDKETLIIGYNANSNTKLCTGEELCGAFAYPPECKGENCLCLCREFEDIGFQSTQSTELSAICKKRTCQPVGEVRFKDNLKMSNFYGDEMPPAMANGYFQNGFIITRGTMEFSALVFKFSELRRAPFIIMYESDGSIGICKKGPCQYQ